MPPEGREGECEVQREEGGRRARADPAGGGAGEGGGGPPPAVPRRDPERPPGPPHRRRDAHEDAVRGDRELHPHGELRGVREGVQERREGVPGMSPLFRNRAREAAEAALKSADETLAIL